MARRTFALVGNPNVGKTVLFNSICNASERVGNWHGVTTGKKVCSIKRADNNVDIVDLPGCYNLSGYSLEEKETANYLNENECEVINICDMRYLERNLYLTLLLLEQNKRVVIFINDYAKYSAKIDILNLKRLLGVEILATTAVNVKVDDFIARDFACQKPKYYDQKFESKSNEEKVLVRYKYIDDILKDCSYKPQKPKHDFDNIFLGKFGLFIFAIISAAIFYICFGGVGSFLSGLVQNMLSNFVFKPIYNFFSNSFSEFTTSFVCDGLLSAGVGIISFLPQIVLVSFFINILQDSGYLSRIAFLFEGILCKVGLSGKAIFSLLVSFGCNTTAVLTTNNQEDKISKKKLAMFLPFVCCSAKLPIFVIFTKVIVDNFGFLLTILLYVISFGIGLIVLFISNKIFHGKTAQTFLLEMGEYKYPSIKLALKDCFASMKGFVIKIGTTIFVANVIVWFLQSFDFSLRYKCGKSILQSLSQTLSFIFAPIGLDNHGVVSALIIGIMAKELVLTTLALVNGIGVEGLGLLLEGGLVTNFSPLTLFIFLVFVAMYSPCISYLMSIKKNFGKKFALTIFFGTSSIAYIVCMVIYFFGKLFAYSKELFIWCLIGILFVIAITFLLKDKGRCRCCSNKNCSKCPK